MGEIGPDVREGLKIELNPKAVSKREDPPGRKKTAEKIIELRAKRNKLRNEIGSDKDRSREALRVASDYLQESEKIEEKLREREEGWLVKIRGWLGVKDNQSEDMRQELELMGQEMKKVLIERKRLDDQIDEIGKEVGELPKLAKLLRSYYEGIANRPLSNEKKRALLKPEILADLTMKEYITLWRRLNPQFLTHITRQGFRDHTGMNWHNAGLYDHQNGFVSVLKNGKKLIPPWGTIGLKDYEEEAVDEWLKIQGVLGEKSEKGAIARFEKIVGGKSISGVPKYPDKMAIHFMAGVVGNDYYGGEKDNEAFFVFPTDIVASQYNFHIYQREKSLVENDTGLMGNLAWNDVYVWPGKNGAIKLTIDAGIVFLPKDTLVDRKTGSVYASKIEMDGDEQRRVMVEDEKLVGQFVNWWQKKYGGNDLIEIADSWKKEEDRETESEFFTELAEGLNLLGFEKSSVINLAKEIIGRIQERYGFNLSYLLAKGRGEKELTFGGVGKKTETVAIDEALKRLKAFSSEELIEAVKKSGANWKRAENSIKAKEYWESFFRENPNLKPNHVYYYNGRPTEAVLTFLTTNGIGKVSTSEEDGSLLGFDDHHVEDIEIDQRAHPYYEEIRKMAKVVIGKHYGS